MSSILLTVIIPCYNEASIISDSLTVLTSYLKTDDWRRGNDGDWEVLVVDDGSSDFSANKVEAFGRDEPRVRSIRLPYNVGQGGALQAGLAAAGGKWILTVDADLDYAPTHIPALLEAAITQKADIAVGSPYMAGGRTTNVPRIRLLMSRLMNAHYRRVLALGLSTYTGILRLYRRRAIEPLLLTSYDKEFLPEILVKAAILRMKIIEVPAELAWQPAIHAMRGRGLNVWSTVSKLLRHLLFGFLERPFRWIRIPLLLATMINLWLGTAILILFFSIWKTTDAGFRVDLTSTLATLFMTAQHTLLLFFISMYVSLTLFFSAAIVLQNRHKYNSDFIMLTKIYMAISRTDREE